MKRFVFTAIMAFIVISTFAKSSKNTAGIFDKKVTSTDSTEFKDYLGIYKMAENPFVEKVKVFFQNGELRGQVTGYPATKLIRKNEDEFEESNYGAVVTFSRVNGIVTEIKVMLQGKELIGTKE